MKNTKMIKSKKDIDLIFLIIITASIVLSITFMIFTPFLLIAISAYGFGVIVSIVTIIAAITKRQKPTKTRLAGLVIGILWICLIPWALLTRSGHSSNAISDLIDNSQRYMRPVVKSATLGDTKVSIYYFSDNYNTLIGGFGDINPGKKTAYIELHAESPDGYNIDESCKFDIVSKVDIVADEKHNNRTKETKNSSPILPDIGDYDYGCPTGGGETYIARMVTTVSSNETKFKLRYLGDKVYYLDLN